MDALYKQRIALVLKLAGMTALPPRTVCSFQNKARPNKFYPVLFTLPAGVSAAEVLKERDWAILVVELEAEKPVRYAVFYTGAFIPSDWTENRNRLYLSIPIGQVKQSFVPIGGGYGFVKEPSLRDWLLNRLKTVLNV